VYYSTGRTYVRFGQSLRGQREEILSSSLITMDSGRLGTRPLILGATGQVGSAMSVLTPSALTPHRSEFDLLHLDSITERLESLGPTAVINCAAWTAVDGAEDNEEEATTVNAWAVQRLAAYCENHRLPFLTFSSDYVFDGMATMPYVESSPKSPLNAYGRSKALGEDLATSACPRALVIRSSWILSGTHQNFVSKILTKLATGAKVQVVNDQWGRPTAAGDLAAAALDSLSHGTSGLLHVANGGQATWFELAREAARAAGFEPDQVQKCMTTDYPTRAARPRYSVLGTERAHEQPPSLPPWKDAVRRLVPVILERLL
jgi:dTDP-4-dehydrorhamnose reductase